MLPRAAGLSVTRLQALVRAELIKADAAAADARRRRAERAADVTVRAVGDGMSELRSVLPTRMRQRCAPRPTRGPAR